MLGLAIASLITRKSLTAHSVQSIFRHSLVLPLKMTVLAILAIFGGGGSAALATTTASTTVEVITSADRPVQNQSRVTADGFIVTVHHTDGIRHFTERLSEGLPSDPAQAEPIAQQRLAQHQHEIKAMVHSLNRIVELEAQGIDRYPVIVINQQYVIYGVTDLAMAVGHWQSWQEEQQRE